MTRIWEAAANESVVEVPGLLEKYTITGDFETDYKQYCSLLNIAVHPGIICSRTISDDQILSTKVEVRGWKVDGGTARSLALAISGSKDLNCVSCWKCEFTTGLQEIMQAVADSERVVHLHLDCITNLNTLLSQLPLEFLSKCFSKLETLSLRSNYLSDEFTRAFAENQSITNLSLWDNNIEDNGAVAIGEALRSNKTLAALSLGKNRIGSVGAEYVALSVSKFKLTAAQLYERKKLIRELEKRKKESINRRRRVTKGKTKKTSEGTVVPPPSASKNTAPTQPKPTAVSPAPAPVTDPTSEAQFDVMIEELQPLEESDGLAYAKGNRNLVSLNLSFNPITDPAIIQLLHKAPEINPILERIVLE